MAFHILCPPPWLSIRRTREELCVQLGSDIDPSSPPEKLYSRRLGRMEWYLLTATDVANLRDRVKTPDQIGTSATWRSRWTMAGTIVGANSCRVHWRTRKQCWRPFGADHYGYAGNRNGSLFGTAHLHRCGDRGSEYLHQRLGGLSSIPRRQALVPRSSLRQSTRIPA